MSEFEESAGRNLGNLIHSIQEEFDRLPSWPVLITAIKEFDPTPQQVGDWAGKCAEAVTKVAAQVMRGVRDAGGPQSDPMPDDIHIPDDLSDLE
jgi:hypothetical protein